ncbi:MAG: glycosyltransferase family 39 protein [Nitrososphaeraceae archaeon]|nr:glycosyltransferase family 39 protein [Nitrososphaeraceae archaeon]MDW0139501.1 glycosyltransferase family 39 protein [Nitrososphaeraceae archaeon]
MTNHGKLKIIILLSILLGLAGYTHLWNVTGFPFIDVDEGHYLRKAISTLEGEGFQPQNRYLSPYFGQIFLAGIFKTIGFPNFIVNDSSQSPATIEGLFLVPRILVGSLAIVDLILIWKITERRYNKRVALISSILFAVMPYNLMTRTVLLESIQLPLMLTSILLLLYSNSAAKHEKKVSIIVSGLFMGLAIFTKIPAFTIIPLGIFLIYTNTKRWKYLALWLIPSILVPSLWPMHAALSGDLDEWVNGIIYQTNREGRPLIDSLHDFLLTDPVFFILGIGGFVFSVLKRDIFLILWIAPLIAFFYLIGYVVPFHLIILIPSFCIAGALLLDSISQKLVKKFQLRVIQYVLISSIVLFALINTSMLISLELNSNYYKAVSFLVGQIPTRGDNAENRSDVKNHNNELTIISSPEYLWIPQSIFNKSFDTHSYYSSKGIKADRFIMMIDDRFLSILGDTSTSRSKIFNAAFNSTHSLKKFDENFIDVMDLKRYPFTSLRVNNNTKMIDIRSNY